jgi:hypothetical protein
LPEIGDHAVLSRTQELLAAPLDRELVGLNVDTGLCYGFSETAAAVWECLERPTTLSEIAKRLTVSFEIDEAECRDEIRPLIGQLAEEGLITVTPPA